MSLFPAYAVEDLETVDIECEHADTDTDSMSSGAECALLEEPAVAVAPPSAAVAPLDVDAPYYVDRRLDVGNLRVSTLYYPARPEYRTSQSLRDGKERERARPPRRRRYWRAVPRGGGGGGGEHEAAQCAARAAALRSALHAADDDEDLWLHYIDFLEWCGNRAGGETAAEAAVRAATRLPQSDAVRGALAGLLAPAELARQCAVGRAAAAGAGAALAAELWAREVSAWTSCGRLEDARDAAVRAAADRTIADHGHLPLFVYGAALRSAGLWERTVQLVELLMALNFPDDGSYAASAAEAGARADAGAHQLAVWETAAARCGLPAAAVWARLERARAALHWRAPAPGRADAAALAADPQRTPPPAADADLLRVCTAPSAALRLLLTLLRLVEEPLLPASSAAARSAAGGAGAARLAADWDAAAGVLLLALLRAARRLPAAAALSDVVRTERAVLALTPLRAVPASDVDDATGFGSWRAALWEAALRSTRGRRRCALLCWRLRVMHARRAPAAAARRLLRRYADADAATPYALYARLEDDPARAATAARGAVRRALRAPADVPAALHAARVLHELGGEGARWALLCATAGQPLPADDELGAPPPPDLVRAATSACEERCADLERRLEEAERADPAPPEEEPEDALLPGDAEWGAARVLLVAPQRRRQLELELQRVGAWRGAAGARYREQCACALSAAASQEHRAADAARSLRHHAPHNAYMALLATEGCGARGGGARGGGATLSEGAVWRHAALLPAVMRAVRAGWDRDAAIALERAAARTARGADAAGAALAAALRLEAAAVTAAAPPAAALTAALHAAPHYKWVYVRGAALGAGCANELADLLLERGLRVHALPGELPLLASTPADGTPADGTHADGTPADGTHADGTRADGSPATHGTAYPALF